MGLAGRGAQALADPRRPAGSAPASSRWSPAAWVELWTDDLDGAYRHLGVGGEPGPTAASRYGSARRWPSSATPSTGAGSSPNSVLHTELAVGDAEENERFLGLRAAARAGLPDARAGARGTGRRPRRTRPGRGAVGPARRHSVRAVLGGGHPGGGSRRPSPTRWPLLAAGAGHGGHLRPGRARHRPPRPAPRRGPWSSWSGRAEADDALAVFGARFAGTGRKSARLGIARAPRPDRRPPAARPPTALASYARGPRAGRGRRPAAGGGPGGAADGRSPLRQGGSSPVTSMPSSPTISAVVTCSYSNEPGSSRA